MWHVPRDLIGTVVWPAKTMGRLLGEGRGARRAFSAVVLAGVLYAASSAALALAGAVPMAPVLPAVSPDNYYFWQMLFALPFALAAWLLVSLVISLAGRSRTPRGTFGRTAACAGFATAVPLILAWLPSAGEAVLMSLGMGQEELVGILSTPGWAQTLYLAVYLAAAVWAAALFGVGAGLSRKLGGGRAALAGVAGAAALTALYVFLVR